MIHSARCLECALLIPIAAFSVYPDVQDQKNPINQDTFESGSQGQCTHWSILVNGRKGHGLFNSRCVSLTITCNRCQKAQPIVIDETIDQWTCIDEPCKVHNDKGIVYSLSTTGNALSVLQFYNRYKIRCDRSQCSMCHSTGQLPIQSFTLCDNCKGSGGVTCMQCCGMYRRFEEYVTRLDIRYQQDCSNCTKGYQTLCQLCLGAKTVVSNDSRHSIACKYCKA